jgi:hypothetical protein
MKFLQDKFTNSRDNPMKDHCAEKIKIIPLLMLVSLIFMNHLAAQKPEETEDWSRKPDVVTPGQGTQPPSDAIVLFGGPADKDNWMGVDGGPISWKVEDVLSVVPKSGDIQTKQHFGDVQLHIEWCTPQAIDGNGQERGNSGIYLMGLYEVQVLDSYENETYYNGQAGSIYKQYIPLVNVCRPPGEWQTFDIFFTVPRFNEDGSLGTPAYITIVQNGVLIQNHVALHGPTVYSGKPSYWAHADRLPLLLQDHSCPVSFRNIWIRELNNL